MNYLTKIDILNLWFMELNHDFVYVLILFSCLNDCSRFLRRIKEKYFMCWLIIIKPQPDLHSKGNTCLGPKGVPFLA